MNRSKITWLLFITAASTLGAECELPDQARNGEEWCSAGRSVLNIDDGDVPDAIFDELYASGGILGSDDATYSDNPPVVIIPYTLSDLPVNSYVTTELIRETFFDKGNSNINDYYLENSWGQFGFAEGAISGWVRLPGTPEQYGVGQIGNDWTRNPDTARDILMGSTVRWEELDTDNNQRIDYPEAQIVFLGPWGGGDATRPSTVQFNYDNQLWTIGNNFVYITSKRGDDPTAGVDSLSSNYPTIVHELNHGLFALPDRYDGFSGEGSTGSFDPQTEAYATMHITLYDKMKIGWIAPPVLEIVPDRPDAARRCYSFPNIETVPAATALVDVNAPDEYWLVENRHIPSSPHGFESGFPESGLAIWWGKNDGSLRLVDASQPDQDPMMYRDQRAGALFKQNTGDERDPATVPHVLFRNEGFFSYAVRGVSPEGATMYAEF